MTKEDSILHVVQAFKDGKTIQSRSRGTSREWTPNTTPSWNFMEVEYRVKPEVVEVVRYAILDPETGYYWGHSSTRLDADCMVESYCPRAIIIELRGSYEKE